MTASKKTPTAAAADRRLVRAIVDLLLEDGLEDYVMYLDRHESDMMMNPLANRPLTISELRVVVRGLRHFRRQLRRRDVVRAIFAEVGNT